MTETKLVSQNDLVDRTNPRGAGSFRHTHMHSQPPLTPLHEYYKLPPRIEMGDETILEYEKVRTPQKQKREGVIHQFTTTSDSTEKHTIKTE
jgi:hypothetical protein